MGYGPAHGLIALSRGALAFKSAASLAGFVGSFVLRRRVVFPERRAA